MEEPRNYDNALTDLHIRIAKQVDHYFFNNSTYEMTSLNELLKDALDIFSGAAEDIAEKINNLKLENKALNVLIAVFTARDNPLLDLINC